MRIVIDDKVLYGVRYAYNNDGDVTVFWPSDCDRASEEVFEDTSIKEASQTVNSMTLTDDIVEEILYDVSQREVIICDKENQKLKKACDIIRDEYITGISFV
jgi:hypothetical protein